MKSSFFPSLTQLAPRFQADITAPQAGTIMREKTTGHFIPIPAFAAKAYGLGGIHFGGWSRNGFDAAFQHLLNQADRATDWAIQATEHGEKISCRLDGKTYECSVASVGDLPSRTNLQVEGDHHLYYKNQSESFEQLFQVAAPILAEQYQLGPDLALTPLLQRISQQLPQCELKEPVSTQPRNEFPRRKHSVQVLLQEGADKTLVSIIQSNRGKHFLAIEKPGFPRQLLVALNGDKAELRLLAEKINAKAPGALDLELLQ